MVRVTVLAAAFLLSVNATAIACSGPSCVPKKVKPADIKQFMRDQAAISRGETLNQIQTANQHLGKTHRAKSSKHKGPRIFASRPKSIATSPSGAAFEPPKLPDVEVVSEEQFNSIDQPALAFDAAPPPAESSARGIVAEAFAEIEGKPESSLEPNDLLAAHKRANQNPSLLRWFWSTLGMPSGAK